MICDSGIMDESSRECPVKIGFDVVTSTFFQLLIKSNLLDFYVTIYFPCVQFRIMESYGSGGGFPQRNSRPFNDPNTSGGNPMMPGAERMVQPVAHYANSNGILSRPGGGGPREDSVGGGGRAQQGDVFMVREASRGSGAVPGGSGADGRSPFATSGNRFQVESGEYAGSDHQQQRQALPPSQQQSAGGGSSSSHSSSHHRDRSERDRDKERDHHQQQRQLPLPKMLKIAVVGK